MKGRTGFLLKGFLFFLLEKNPVNVSMKSFSEVLLSNSVSFLFSGTELKFLKIKSQRRSHLKERLDNLYLFSDTFNTCI